MQHQTTAQQRKDTGQQLALFKAGKNWTNQAIACLRRFIEDRADDGEHLFTFEQFRIYAEESGLPKPDSINAWGALTKSAQLARICMPTDQFIKAQRPESHARMIRVWRAGA